MARKVYDLARNDSADAKLVTELLPFFDRVAAAMRENQHARLAADHVKDDAAQSPAPETYAANINRCSASRRPRRRGRRRIGRRPACGSAT